MKFFDLLSLIWPTAAIYFGTIIVVFCYTKSPILAISAAFVKSAIFLVYFGFIFDGTYTFLDDWTYLQGGYDLLSQGIRLTNLAENWEYLLKIGKGKHWVYYLYNTYAFIIFGEGYYAPVALNILLTISIAYYGAKLAADEFGISRKNSKLLFIFILLHPDILAWSNIMNGKDILVLQLHVLLLIAVSLFFRGQLIRSIGLAIPVSLILFFLRFYVPILFAAALASSIFLSRVRFKHILLMAASLIMTFLWIGEDSLQHAINSISEHFVNPLYGFIRILLTPIPFHTEEAYAFLNLPAVIHWMLIPFVARGLLCIWRLKTPFSRFFVLYLFFFS